ncbi:MULTISPECIES: S41 family peptidase [unclassified Lentimicrobium]|uniref:S41 family peptidase n=1 Tax=unclassified Lentimicrobium TaxID=2677434 RepID=UPI0015581A53|nr:MULTISPECIES: S41 family peptidase [unclassified Lentimicrobium]NPD47875.1 S41 family peptidase [Lentimicrobium sp. S6]NPD83542.1 S41 family peptidase [Lentimicrobium sp. L6]NPD85969.1 S41 family peptidase [Lentimicrobium sp. L6]
MRSTFTLFLSSLLLLSQIAVAQNKSHAFEISKNLDIYATLIKELNNNYVEEINPGELNTIALDAMLSSLDPYTIYIPESKIEDMKFLTTGEYGGIGVSVIKRDDKVIIASLEGNSPAVESGLLAGDEVISIDGQDLSELTDEEISLLLKGQPGTPTQIVLKRWGITEFIIKEVLRRNLNVDNIPFYGMLDSAYAYINLTSFTKDAASKSAKAFLELKKNNPQGLIFDLRGNGGGLIGEAVDILNIFIDNGQEVVRTKGRLREKNYIYKTRKSAIDLEMPVVFLVDRNSASASEIVSGAIQDLDRGVILGERTYGKGLVQSVLPLSFNSQFKVTIAKYYIPSGRCIQAIDYSHKDKNGDAILVNDSLLEAFKTKNGRTVYDGRGIKPDVILSPKDFSDISEALIDKFLIFDFCTEYRLSHDSIAAADEFEISEVIWNDFLTFLKGKDISYKSALELQLDKIKKQIVADSLYDGLEEICEQIQQKIDAKKENEIEEHKDEIIRILKTDLVSRYYYTKGVIVANLYEDRAIAKAISLISNIEEYNKILKIDANK